MTTAVRTAEHVTCLGCGCACDDITIVVRAGRIAEARNACSLGSAWFGDGLVPTEIRSAGQAVTLDQAMADTANLLERARRPLVYLAPDLSVEAQRAGVAIADRLGAMLDTPTSEQIEAVLAAQRRGKAGATLGETRRADMIVFWGIDPAARCPRYRARYATGSGERRTIAVDLGEHRGPADAAERVALDPAAEVDALAVIRATVLGHASGGGAGDPATALARRLMSGRYVVLVHDAERTDADSDSSEALIALAEALNGPTRCALSGLRSGGNRSGADLVLTWQTGFPVAVDFAAGYPCYRPREGAATLLARREIDAALMLGSPGSIPAPVSRGLGSVRVAVIGPRASAAAFTPQIAVDTGVAGIHEAGMAFRMDDVPLPLTAVLDGPRTTLSVVRALGERLSRP